MVQSVACLPGLAVLVSLRQAPWAQVAGCLGLPSFDVGLASVFQHVVAFFHLDFGHLIAFLYQNPLALYVFAGVVQLNRLELIIFLSSPASLWTSVHEVSRLDGFHEGAVFSGPGVQDGRACWVHWVKDVLCEVYVLGLVFVYRFCNGWFFDDLVLKNGRKIADLLVEIGQLS